MLTFKISLTLILALVLTGCATSKENFDCQYGKGVGCRSITEVNTLVNEGKLGENDPINPRSKSPAKLSDVSISSDFTSADSMIVQRVTEEHLRIWFAPFQDKQGHFHEASIIHTVLRPGFWQVQEGI